ncbi:AcrR family transcriptional regulator [Pantoea sp. RIT-PI-b]|uniref:TetR/AcrR family transcriptional regulator n=1 Tax=Pantoea sp. RIT-PI-b TaxID=1681195 RepID=UPI0006767BC5|nr:TetR/AcrR family transcriptional regulator [Pantoea sp. RIT-PI-b]KNC05715.1 AcrR family transcriptional regulator [Pantoea sp. RIT-PI-b]
MTEQKNPAATRGPSDHTIRDQIVAAAMEYFSHYGFEKTTVSDLARSIGFSKAYIYKFFGSKQEIGEVICVNCLTEITARLNGALDSSPSATEKIRQLFKTLAVAGSELFFRERRLYDIAAASSREHWAAAVQYEASLRATVLAILREGRAAGEFERKTALDETAAAVYLVLKPLADPLQLQTSLDTAEEDAIQLAALVLRSLAP